jgi:hypothetical protein
MTTIFETKQVLENRAKAAREKKRDERRTGR